LDYRDDRSDKEVVRLSRPFTALAVAVAALAVSLRAGDDGWIIERLNSRIEIDSDGTLSILEALDVDFRGLSKHGIFRDIPYVLDFDTTNNREYAITLTGVTSADGRPHRVKESDVGADRRFQIGDPDKEISGKQTYRIAYRVGGALNGFPDHDELYWNATGVWPVAMAAASVVVRVPAGSVQKLDCFQGPKGSTERCSSSAARDQAIFKATRSLAADEQMTVVVALRKGAVAEPHPLLVRKPRGVLEFFELTPFVGAVTVFGILVAVGGIGYLWWEIGRDRHSIALHTQGPGAPEERVPLFGARPVGVEFEPPDRIRPGQMGLLVDERVDTLDVTATIVDLAVRGYLSIRELPKEGWFGKKDWQLVRLMDPDSKLLEYERIVFAGLFEAGPSQTLSGLKNKFYDDLGRARKALYKDAVERGWFPRNPNSVRVMSRAAGILAVVAGVGLMILLGQQSGDGLLGLPVLVGGALLAIIARAMPRRTALGREMMRRTLGFAKYMKTAETEQQAFAERANIFTAYLPYAVAFKCVDRWARAFQDIDMQAATATWYAGSTAFDPGAFSSTVSSLSSSMSSALASTPGGSGGSGFSGGSSGGGGGGGGGGSW
jgi:uncharacterized protein (TIGR04222 family)